MPNQKIILHSTFTLFCTCCGAVVISDINPTKMPDTKTAIFLLTDGSCICPKCSNNSEFNITRSEIKRLLIE